MTSEHTRRQRVDHFKTLVSLGLVSLALVITPIAAKAQTMTDSTLIARVQQLEDRAALKTLVDTFSNLADRKEIDAQVLLFTEDATVESRVEGRPGSTLRGRRQLAEAFGAYLANFDTVYHQNGQQTVEIKGDVASGPSYCLVVLIGVQDGRRIKTTSGVIYRDDYVRQEGRWLIAKRASNFVWRETTELPAPAR